MLPADLPLLQMDAVLMERLFTNLFENAAKYTPADTPLDIGAERVTDDGLPFVRVLVDDMVRPAGRDGNADLRQVHARREGIGDARHRPRPRDLPRDRRSTAVKSARSTGRHPTAT